MSESCDVIIEIPEDKFSNLSNYADETVGEIAADETVGEIAADETVGEIAADEAVDEPIPTPADEAVGTPKPKYGPSEEGYITPYSHTIVHRAGVLISEAILGVFSVLGDRVQVITLSNIAPPEEFWSLCDHPSETILFLDMPLGAQVLRNFCADKGFCRVVFVAGATHSGDGYLPLEYIHTILPRACAHLSVKQILDLVARSRIPGWSSVVLEEKPSLGSSFGLVDAPELIRGIAAMGLDVRSATSQVAARPLRAEEYIHDWIVAGKASASIYGIISEGYARSARSRLVGEPAVRVISLVADILTDKICDAVALSAEKFVGATVILICYPAKSGLWSVNQYIHSTGDHSETAAEVTEGLEKCSTAKTDVAGHVRYVIPTECLARYVDFLGDYSA